MLKQIAFEKIRMFLSLMLLFTLSESFAQEDLGTEHIGKDSFKKNCAACHGISGIGNGPFVEFLNESPADLTLISQKNGGIYPQHKVYELIRDPQRVRAHGSKEMPIWGDRFSREIIEFYGPDYTGPGSSVNERILELVFYIGTLQK